MGLEPTTFCLEILIHGLSSTPDISQYLPKNHRKSYGINSILPVSYGILSSVPGEHRLIGTR